MKGGTQYLAIAILSCKFCKYCASHTINIISRYYKDVKTETYSLKRFQLNWTIITTSWPVYYCTIFHWSSLISWALIRLFSYLLKTIVLLMISRKFSYPLAQWIRISHCPCIPTCGMLVAMYGNRMEVGKLVINNTGEMPHWYANGDKFL